LRGGINSILTLFWKNDLLNYSQRLKLNRPLDYKNAMGGAYVIFMMEEVSLRIEISDGLDRPTSMEIISNTAYIVTLTGEIWTINNLSGPPFGK